MGFSRLLAITMVLISCLIVFLPNCYLFALPQLSFMKPYDPIYLNEASQINLRNKVVVIIGASQGLGADLSVIFARHGASVYTSFRHVMNVSGS